MDWSLSISHITKDDEGPSNLAMAPLKINGDKKLYGTLLPVGDIDSTDLKRISIIARDIQLIVLYDQEGKSAGVRRPNSKLPMDIDGVKRNNRLSCTFWEYHASLHLLDARQEPVVVILQMCRAKVFRDEVSVKYFPRYKADDQWRR